MRSWPAPEVPRPPDRAGGGDPHTEAHREVPGPGPALRLHDTGSGSLRPTEPGETARMYVCGITPYDATHLGHANTYVAFDLVNRLWRDRGHRVHYVQNVTDVDDPLLERAERDGLDWRDLAEREIDLFRQDMAALRVLPPDQYVGVVEAIPLVVEMISALRARGAAYDVEGDIYFPVSADPGFGRVSGLTTAEMAALFAERGGDPGRRGKKDPLDALLWRAERPGEPAWDSPLGRGRPGWHIECSAISLRYLGMAFDLEGGGSDLAFPHHEMSAAHAQVATGRSPHARVYAHAGMVALDGEKMSKSKGNLVFVSTLRRAGTDPMAIRLALLARHYRSDWEWTAPQLDAAIVRLAQWRAAVARAAGPDGTRVLTEVRAALSRDLDAPAALAAVDRWAAGTGGDPAAPGQVRAIIDALLGVAL